MEKVINEFKVIETDDGYRIEIKGDKERLKSMMKGFGRPWHHGGRRKWRKRFRKHWGMPFGFRPFDWMFYWGGPEDFTSEGGPEEEDSEA
jgi:hypothetical protein